ncbi:MAG: hypothetical protein IPG53_16140 [Ignavibacteriales bacterium]|nr:hypothetical protein [Ignavibacteriales bacterium]
MAELMIKRRVEEVTSNDLQKALDEIVAGKPVLSSTKAFAAPLNELISQVSCINPDIKY